MDVQAPPTGRGPRGPALHPSLIGSSGLAMPGNTMLLNIWIALTSAGGRAPTPAPAPAGRSGRRWGSTVPTPPRGRAASRTPARGTTTRSRSPTGTSGTQDTCGICLNSLAVAATVCIYLFILVYLGKLCQLSLCKPCAKKMGVSILFIYIYIYS